MKLTEYRLPYNRIRKDVGKCLCACVRRKLSTPKGQTDLLQWAVKVYECVCTTIEVVQWFCGGKVAAATLAGAAVSAPNQWLFDSGANIALCDPADPDVLEVFDQSVTILTVAGPIAAKAATLSTPVGRCEALSTRTV